MKRLPLEPGEGCRWRSTILKAAGTNNWVKGPAAIAKIDSARRAGVDVQADMYPYVAGGTGLSACTPPWASENGKLIDNLQNPEMRAKIKAEMNNAHTEWENLCLLAGPQGVLVLGLNKPENKQYAGKRLGEIATMMNKSWDDAAMDLLISERQRIGTVYFLMSEDNVKLNLAQPWIKFGTDAGGVDPDSARGLTHPRAYGTFPKILGHYVRDEKVMPLEDAVRKATSAVATRLSIPDRGLLRRGVLRRYRGVRPEHDHRPLDIRAAARVVGGREARVRERSARGSRRTAYRREARTHPARPGGALKSGRA